MVKEMVGDGRHYRSFLEEIGVDLKNYGKLFFRRGDGIDDDRFQDEELVLKRLSGLPEFDDISLRVTNVVNTDGSDLHLILTDKGCPRLRDSKYPVTGEMPNPNETFLVGVSNVRDLSQHCKVPVLSLNPQEASSIARRKFQNQIGVSPIYLQAEPELVRPDEWVEYCRHLILDKGEDLPDFITQYADLRACQEEARLRRLSKIPSTILPAIIG